MQGFNTKVVSTKGLPISVAFRPGCSKSREYVALGGLGFGTKIGVHNPSLVNVLRGLVERVFRVEGRDGLTAPPQPKKGQFRKLGVFTSRLLRRLGSCRPWSVDEFVNSYRGAKQAAVRAAAESVAHSPVCKADAELRTFVKAEKLNLSKKPDPAPRIIQPRNPRYNAAVGPFLKRIEHQVYRAIADVWGGPTVMKGYNARETGDHLAAMWSEFSDPVGVGLDASRFDQHVSAEALEWEHGVYNSIFHDADLARYLKWQVDNKGIAFTPEGRVKYQVKGCRMSGDMNTALGNCLIMCALVFTYCLEKGIKARLANNGDDCMVIMNRKDLNKFNKGLREWFLAYGFNMTVEPPAWEIERLEFCQTRPVKVAGGWIMVRNPRLVMDKDCINLHPHNLPYAQWLGHVGTCGGALCAGIPILQEFYTVLRGLGGPNGRAMEMTGMDMMAQGLTCHLAPIQDDTRISFFKAYGIAPWEQLALEEELRVRGANITVGPCVEGYHTAQSLFDIPDGWL